jgi:hypothetical protein
MKIINGYEYVYASRLITSSESNILYYKVRDNTSLFTLELFKKYDIINASTKKTCEITNFGSIADAIAIISEDVQLTSIFVGDFQMIPRLAKHKLAWRDKYPSHKHINVHTIKQFRDEMHQRNSLDFVFIHICVYAYQSVQIMLYFQALQSLYALLLIYDKVVDGGDMILAFFMPYTTFEVKVLAIYCMLFEEYVITTAESNIDRRHCTYLILKNKKPVGDRLHEQLQNMLKTLESNCENMGMYDELQSDTIYITQSNETERTKEIIEFLAKQSDKYITDIEIIDPYLKKTYKKVRSAVKKYNAITYIKYLMFYDKVKELYKLDQAGQLTDRLISKYKKLAIYELLAWSKKYDIRLTELRNRDKWSHAMRSKIYKDVVSYERDVRFDFKSHPVATCELQTDGTIDIHQIPSYYADAIQKNLYETRALDHRDMTTYHQVKVQIDYYFRKLTKQIAQRYNLTHGYVTQAWIKMTEILHRVKGLVPMDDRQTLTTFHICELPGAFINALTHFVDTETSYELKWIAQSLNPANLSKHDQREAFGDEAQLVQKHPNNYDFGPKKTGDIIDPENIRYYAKHYNKNDLVTADCGLPYRQKDLSYILSFATYLLVFLTTSEHGNALIKRYVPINNNQEIYMMYLFYVSFKKTILFKPRVNYQSQEYYLIGLDYTPIDPDILERLIRFLESYRLQGIVSIDQIPHSFLAQLDKAQHIMLDNLNDFIQKKIYFADNFSELTDTDWQEINHAIKDKIEEWFADVPMKKRRTKRT